MAIIDPSSSITSSLNIISPPQIQRLIRACDNTRPISKYSMKHSVYIALNWTTMRYQACFRVFEYGYQEDRFTGSKAKRFSRHNDMSQLHWFSVMVDSSVPLPCQPTLRPTDCMLASNEIKGIQQIFTHFDSVDDGYSIVSKTLDTKATCVHVSVCFRTEINNYLLGL